MAKCLMLVCSVRGLHLLCPAWAIYCCSRDLTSEVLCFRTVPPLVRDNCLQSSLHVPSRTRRGGGLESKAEWTYSGLCSDKFHDETI